MIDSREPSGRDRAGSCDRRIIGKTSHVNVSSTQDTECMIQFAPDLCGRAREAPDLSRSEFPRNRRA